MKTYIHTKTSNMFVDILVIIAKNVTTYTSNIKWMDKQ